MFVFLLFWRLLALDSSGTLLWVLRGLELARALGHQAAHKGSELPYRGLVAAVEGVHLDSNVVDFVAEVLFLEHCIINQLVVRPPVVGILDF